MGVDETGIFKLNEQQNNAINEARKQIENGQTLTDEQANKESDEWLSR